MCLLCRDAIVLTSPLAPGVQFEVKRVELQGSATLFCCWLVKDLLHSHQDSATRTRLLLASLPSSSHSMLELSGSSVGEVRLCAQLLPCTRLTVWEGILPGLSLFLSASSGMGGGSVWGFFTLPAGIVGKSEATRGILNLSLPHEQGRVLACVPVWAEMERTSHPSPQGTGGAGCSGVRYGTEPMTRVCLLSPFFLWSCEASQSLHFIHRCSEANPGLRSPPRLWSWRGWRPARAHTPTSTAR